MLGDKRSTVRTAIGPLLHSNKGLGDADASKSIGATPSLAPTGTRSRFDPCVKTASELEDNRSFDPARLWRWLYLCAAQDRRVTVLGRMGRTCVRLVVSYVERRKTGERPTFGRCRDWTCSRCGRVARKSHWLGYESLIFTHSKS